MKSIFSPEVVQSTLPVLTAVIDVTIPLVSLSKDSSNSNIIKNSDASRSSGPTTMEET